jgi:hypothetical protein
LLVKRDNNPIKLYLLTIRIVKLILTLSSTLWLQHTVVITGLPTVYVSVIGILYIKIDLWQVHKPPFP